MPKPPPPDSVFWKGFNVLTEVNTRLFRLTRGLVGGRFGPVRILLLHHVGRRTGRARVTPLLYVPEGDGYVIVASKGGSDKHPAWYHNLMAAPDTEVEVPGGKRVAVRARVATADERPELWRRLDRMWPPYRSYRSYTDREIPLIILERR
jgi:deazaflavin-dependent oxidoreductase (nitroreductase family)